MTARSFISSHRNCRRFLAATHHAAIINNYAHDLQVLHFTLERGLPIGFRRGANGESTRKVKRKGKHSYTPSKCSTTKKSRASGSRNSRNRMVRSARIAVPSTCNQASEHDAPLPRLLHQADVPRPAVDLCKRCKLGPYSCGPSTPKRFT